MWNPLKTQMSIFGFPIYRYRDAHLYSPRDGTVLELSSQVQVAMFPWQLHPLCAVIGVCRETECDDHSKTTMTALINHALANNAALSPPESLKESMDWQRSAWVYICVCVHLCINDSKEIISLVVSSCTWASQVLSCVSWVFGEKVLDEDEASLLFVMLSLMLFLSIWDATHVEVHLTVKSPDSLKDL